jgi:3-hydroxyacyl-[acyl-carrier-protein] dehydratase
MRFLFVDKILRIENGKRALMVKNVSMSEDYFSVHFPDLPVMPGALMLEALEQASAIFISFLLDFKAYPVLKRVSNAKFRRIVRPGDQMVLDVRMKSFGEGFAVVAGKILVDDKKSATTDLIFSVLDDGDAETTKALANMKSVYDILTQDVNALFSRTRGIL